MSGADEFAKVAAADLTVSDAVTDETLMLRYRDGDAAAFDRLYARHKGPLYRYFLRQCGDDRAAVDELFQDVWMKLINARERYRPRARFTTYLYHMAHNRLLDHYRARRRRFGRFAAALPASYRDEDAGGVDVEQLPAAAGDGPEQREIRRRDVERLQTLLAALPEAQREAFLLQHEAGLTLDAIAEVTGCGRETVKSRLRYALAKLRQGLAEEL